MHNFSIKQAQQHLAQQKHPFAELFSHGSLQLGMYAPKQQDLQQPHDRDELYVIASGHAEFFNNGKRSEVSSGDVLFVAASAEHRFENFSDDFATWVMFYGPEGGEA